MLLSESVSEFMPHDIHGNQRVERRVSISKRDVPTVPESVLKTVSEVHSNEKCVWFKKRGICIHMYN